MKGELRIENEERKHSIDTNSCYDDCGHASLFPTWGGTVWPDFGTIEYIVYWCIDAFVFVCVNLFVLVSGYCLVAAEFNLSRIVRVWVDV